MGDMNNEMIDIKNFACHANYKDLIKKANLPQKSRKSNKY